VRVADRFKTVRGTIVLRVDMFARRCSLGT